MEISIFLIFTIISIILWQLTACTNTAGNFEEWFRQLNSELSSIYRQSAHFAWDLRYKNGIMYKLVDAWLIRWFRSFLVCAPMMIQLPNSGNSMPKNWNGVNQSVQKFKVYSNWPVNIHSHRPSPILLRWIWVRVYFVLVQNLMKIIRANWHFICSRCKVFLPQRKFVCPNTSMFAWI